MILKSVQWPLFERLMSTTLKHLSQQHPWSFPDSTDSLCLLQGKMTLVPLTSCWPTRPTGSCLMLSFAPTCRHSFLIQQIFYWIDWFEIGKICSGQTGFAAKYTVAGQTCQVMLLSHHAVLRCLHISNRGSCITSNHYTVIVLMWWTGASELDQTIPLR